MLRRREAERRRAEEEKRRRVREERRRLVEALGLTPEAAEVAFDEAFKGFAEGRSAVSDGEGGCFVGTERPELERALFASGEPNLITPAGEVGCACSGEDGRRVLGQVRASWAAGRHRRLRPLPFGSAR